MKLKLALLCALGLASANAMACYTVYDRSNQVVYNSQTPPVDMSRPLHETLPVAFPGGHMVFGSGTECVRDVPVITAAPARTTAGKPAPLLTDRRTAAALNVPHTILPSGVALVNNPPPMRMGVSVLASSTPTRAAVPVAAPATLARSTSPRQETVITEMHNPPLTVIQQGGMVLSGLR